MEESLEKINFCDSTSEGVIDGVFWITQIAGESFALPGLMRRCKSMLFKNPRYCAQRWGRIGISLSPFNLNYTRANVEYLLCLL